MSQPQLPPLSAFYRQCNLAASEVGMKGIQLSDLFKSYKTMENGLPDISVENCIASTYATVNPAVVQGVLSQVKNIAAGIKDDQSGSTVNAFMTFGGNTNSADYLAGFIAGIHFLQDKAYVAYQDSTNGFNRDDLHKLREVLAKLNIPTYEIENPENDKTFKEQADYLSELLCDFISWSKNNSQEMMIYKSKHPEVNREKLLPVSNYDVASAISAISMNTLPSVPFTAFFIRQFVSSNPLELSTKLVRDVKFEELFSKEFIELNGPKIIVESEKCPIMGTYPQPLGQLIYGEMDGPDVTWMGMFVESEELKRLCKQANVSIRELKEFIINATYDKYKQELANKNPVAVLIERQKLIGTALKNHLMELDKLSGAEPRDYEI